MWAWVYHSAYHGYRLGPSKTKSPSLAWDLCLTSDAAFPASSQGLVECSRGVLSATINIYYTHCAPRVSIILPVVGTQINSISQTALQLSTVRWLNFAQRVVDESVVLLPGLPTRFSHISDPPCSFLLLCLVKVSMMMLEWWAGRGLAFESHFGGQLHPFRTSGEQQTTCIVC